MSRLPDRFELQSGCCRWARQANPKVEVRTTATSRRIYGRRAPEELVLRLLNVQAENMIVSDQLTAHESKRETKC